MNEKETDQDRRSFCKVLLLVGLRNDQVQAKVTAESDERKGDISSRVKDTPDKASRLENRLQKIDLLENRLSD